MSSLWAVLAAGLVLTLALAAIARTRPAVAPLVGSLAFATLGIGAAVLVTEGRLAGSPLVLLLILASLLVFFVRAAGVLLRIFFLRRRGEAPPALLDSVVAVFLYALGAAVIAYRWFGVQAALLLVPAAVAGAAVALALQDELGDLFAGIVLQAEAPFRVGDWVRVGERVGKVEHLSWRSTRLRTWEGDVLTLPNRQVARHAILNFSRPGPRSRTLSLVVSDETPPNKVIATLEAIFPQVAGLAPEPPPSVRIAAQEEAGVRYEVRYAAPSYEDGRRIESEIYRLAWYQLRRHGIERPPRARRTPPPDAEPAGRAAPAADRLQRALEAVDLFEPLSEEERRAAAARFRAVHYAGGEKIIEEGAPGDSFFLIDSGEVQVSRKMGGYSRELARLMDGQFFGEMALLTGEPRAATVVAASDVDLFVLDKTGFQDIIAANPAMAVDISSILAERREALSQAEGDVTHRFDIQGNPAELKARILDRIRVHFGV